MKSNGFCLWVSMNHTYSDETVRQAYLRGVFTERIMLTSQQAAAVRNLISHAVKGLDVSNVSISDSQGNTYSAGSTGSTDASQLKLTLEEQVNNKVRAEILAVLTPLYGEDNVRVAVNSTVNIDHTVGETTTYTEPTCPSSPVKIRSRCVKSC